MASLSVNTLSGAVFFIKNEIVKKIVQDFQLLNTLENSHTDQV